jgi:hypothetical protein
MHGIGRRVPTGQMRAIRPRTRDSMTHQVATKLVPAVLAGALGVLGAPRLASADATCSSLIPAKFSYLTAHAGYYDVEVTVTRDSLHYVTYSKGYVELNGSYLYGTANLEFSDRYNGTQNFNINATEQTQLWIDQTGHVWFYDNNYGYWIVSGTDMQCDGTLIHKYVSGVGVVTVAIRDWHYLG